MKKKIKYKDLVEMNPCYMPDEIGITKGYSAKVSDFIKEYRDKVKKPEDITWVVCRNDYMTGKDMRLFAVWCAREALKLADSPDEVSVNALDVTERYANGEATKGELDAARYSARAAEWADASDAVRAAAMAAARDAASVAVMDAARDAVRVAVMGAASDAVRAAAWAAVCDAECDAARSAQIDKLLTYFD